jgi:signal peptidase I
LKIISRKSQFVSPLKSRIVPAIAILKDQGKEIRLEVQGESMIPLIKSGDSITVRPLGLDAVTSGDIITFIQKDNLIVHRLIKKKISDGARQFCQKGDNLSGWSWIDENFLLGKIISVHSTDITIDMTNRRQSIKNRLIGTIEWLWVTIYEILRPSERYITRRSTREILSEILRKLRSIKKRVVQSIVLTNDNENQ